MIFSQKNSKFVPLKEKPIKKENEIQAIVQNNLENIFSLNFVASEFRVENFRFDTLAYDEESKAFVIIEYKRDQNFSVVDQGLSYLST